MLIEFAAHGHMTPEGIREQCQKLFVSLPGSKEGRGSSWYLTIPLRAHCNDLLSHWAFPSKDLPSGPYLI